MIKDLIIILKLISDLMQLAHPIIQDIRYLFCQVLSNGRCWDSREEWDMGIRGWNYSLVNFIKVLIKDNLFRKNIIKVLLIEKDNLSR